MDDTLKEKPDERKLKNLKRLEEFLKERYRYKLDRQIKDLEFYLTYLSEKTLLEKELIRINSEKCLSNLGVVLIDLRLNSVTSVLDNSLKIWNILATRDDNYSPRGTYGELVKQLLEDELTAWTKLIETSKVFKWSSIKWAAENKKFRENADKVINKAFGMEEYGSSFEYTTNLDFAFIETLTSRP